MTRSHVVLCYGKAYLLYLSPLCLAVYIVLSYPVSLKKMDEFAERSKKKSFYCPAAQNNCDMPAGAGYGR